MLAKLNSPQREAVKYLDGPLLVLAGAGSGKTRVITHKIVHLIDQCGYAPKHIAAITFTNKAAREMQERVGHLLQGKQSKGLTVATFHSLGLQMLRQEAQLLGYKPQFSILDASDSFKILADVLATTDKQLLKRTQWQISQWKNALLTPDHALKRAEEEFTHAAARIYQIYQQTLKAYQAVDFDDLMRLPVELFTQHPAALEKWQHRLRYLLIDEYQDTNACQYKLVKLLTGKLGYFTAVGDDDQAIYAWRGAEVENLRQLTTDFPRLKVIKLEQNYRSTVRILRAANHLIANNPKLFEKKLWSELGTGDPIQIRWPRMKSMKRKSWSCGCSPTSSNAVPGFPTMPFSTAVTIRRGHSSSNCAITKCLTAFPAGHPSSNVPRSRISSPTCAWSPTRTTIRPSSARPPRPKKASATPPWNGSANMLPVAMCRCSRQLSSPDFRD